MNSSTSAVEAEDLALGAEALVGLLRERATEIDELGAMPTDVNEAIDAAGLYKLGTPRKWGGFDPVPGKIRLRIYNALGRGNGSAAWSVVVGSQTGLEMFSEQAQAEVYASGHVGPIIAGSGGNAAHSPGIGERVDGGVMVHGYWSFSSGIRRSGWLLAGMAIHEDGRDVRYNGIIPRGQYEIADDWLVNGMRGTSSNTAYITEPVFVPEHRLARPPWEAEMPEEPDPGSQIAASWENIEVAAVLVGMAQGALELFIEKALRRAPWAQPYERIADMPTVHAMVGRHKTRIDTAYAALAHWTALLEESEDGNDLPNISSACISVMHDMREIPEELRNAMGSSTALITDALGRYARDATTLCLHVFYRQEWDAESHGRSLFGIEATQAPTFSTALGKVAPTALPSFPKVIEPPREAQWQT